jgi:hypothetical protein
VGNSPTLEKDRIWNNLINSCKVATKEGGYVALDQNSDCYSQGGILSAILATNQREQERERSKELKAAERVTIGKADEEVR